MLPGYAQSRGEYIRRLMNFDPQQYAQQAIGSAVGSHLEGHRRAEAARAASLNSRGLFRSNIGGAAAARDLNERIAQSVAGLSMEAAGLESQRVGAFGNIAAQDLERETAARQFQHDQQFAQRQERTDRRGQALGLVGTGVGALLGGPIGGALGSGISRLFGWGD